MYTITLPKPVRRPLFYLFLMFTALSASGPCAADTEPRLVRVSLGDYRYMPENISLRAGQPVVLQLVNTDLITPHNFTLQDDQYGLDVDVDIPAGDTVEVPLLPLWPGQFTFYCNRKLLFMDSHRQKGMEGHLLVEMK